MGNLAGYALEANIGGGYALEANIGGVSMLRGADGKSAYEIAVQNGYTGTETEWLASLKGDAFTFSDFTDEQLAALKGADGTSPTVATSKTEKVTTITVTDKDGEHTATINDGADATDEQVQAATDAWLEAHPEATTTVQDGSITEAKLSESLAGKISSAGYVYDEDGAKYSMAVVDGEIVLTRVYEQFPGKEIVAEFTPEDCVAIDGATGYVRYKLYNRATGEWNRLYFASSDASGAVQPFVDNESLSTSVSTKAREMLLANSTGAVSFVFVTKSPNPGISQGTSDAYLGSTTGLFRFYGSNGWDSLAVKLGAKYVNTS